MLTASHTYYLLCITLSQNELHQGILIRSVLGVQSDPANIMDHQLLLFISCYVANIMTSCVVYIRVTV